ncbi:uncharacterized protein I303_108405 [Kwoniella dejecticola CBS 10117]|uniref:diphosphoinositol-polyphosphate diphosphatase n=1 Tax=Kwoniella dejecticola CBS 10117 TaxID=1296121 RepID=A0A1A5ZXH6_9TREE|nr:tyrosine specific protein phosphatase [Kwoniella dejecticola CBS 10117]OBR82508.1 tyrosine specific protein phosphatase [Kwoniella dejecticola CBS 10117]
MSATSKSACQPGPIPQFLASILSQRIEGSNSINSTYPPHSNSSSPVPNPSNQNGVAQQQPPPNPLYLPPPALPSVEEDLVPPENFALVSKGVYRSGFPKKRNFGFMQTLRLKTVLTLVLEDYPEANLEWCQSQDIQFMQFGIPGNKEPFDNIPEDVICSALVAILDVRNHPVLIHCNKGKHRTGCLIGCIRRLQAWSLTSIFDEYRRFSSPKSRAVDQQFIDLFDLMPVWNQLVQKGGGLDNLPKWDMLSIPRRGIVKIKNVNQNQGQSQHNQLGTTIINATNEKEEERVNGADKTIKVNGSEEGQEQGNGPGQGEDRFQPDGIIYIDGTSNNRSKSQDEDKDQGENRDGVSDETATPLKPNGVGRKGELDGVDVTPELSMKMKIEGVSIS